MLDANSLYVKLVNEQQVKNEINEQLLLFDDTISKMSYMGVLEKFQKDLVGNEVLKNLYSKQDTDELFSIYLNCLKRLRGNLFNDNDSEEMIIAKACEYTRMMTFHDNLMVDQRTKLLDELNKSSVCPMIIGKGSSLAQTRLVRDMLPNTMDSIVSRVSNPLNLCDTNRDVLIARVNGEYWTIDVANYNGTSKSMNRDYKVSYYSENVKPLVLQDEMIESARKQVVSYLIKELKVDEISSIIINDSMSDLDKQYAIMGYISTKIVPAKMNTAFNIAEINGRLIEVGKLLELFFMYNNIHYKINGEAKEKSIYEVKVDGINYKLDPKDMYNATYGVLSDYLHYTEADGNRYYLSLLDENNYREYRTKIDRSVLVGAYVDEEVFNKGVKKSLVI